MHRVLKSVLVPAFCWLLCTGPGPGLTGNDTGGIITWSPEHMEMALNLAGEHCARYNKTAAITSVTPRYGDYIAFACMFDPHRPLP